MTVTPPQSTRLLDLASTLTQQQHAQDALSVTPLATAPSSARSAAVSSDFTPSPTGGSADTGAAAPGQLDPQAVLAASWPGVTSAAGSTLIDTADLLSDRSHPRAVPAHDSSVMTSVPPSTNSLLPAASNATAAVSYATLPEARVTSRFRRLVVTVAAVATF